MKCPYLVATSTNKKRNVKEVIHRGFEQPQWFKDWVKRNAAIVSECDGKIIADVYIETEGGCGCCGYSSIRVTYKCKECKSTIFPNHEHYGALPTSLDLSDIVTKYVAELPEEFNRLTV